jgi:hypothetical protein
MYEAFEIGGYSCDCGRDEQENKKGEEKEFTIRNCTEASLAA